MQWLLQTCAYEAKHQATLFYKTLHVNNKHENVIERKERRKKQRDTLMGDYCFEKRILMKSLTI